MTDITTIFDELISQHGSIDIAEFEFKKIMHEDDDIHELYRQWCRDNGSSEKNGFFDYCNEYLDTQNDVWNSLNEFEDE